MSIIRSARLASSLMIALLLLAACGQAATPTTAPTSPPQSQATTAPAATSAAQPAGTTAAKPSGTASSQAATGEEVQVGLFGPMSGTQSQYGKNFSQAISIAVTVTNENGGINNHPVKVVEEDDRNDPKEAANIAQKFVANPDILAVIGGFSSASSMSAAPIYQKAGIVQLCPTCSHPEFTKDGDYIFSISNPQADEGPFNAKFTVETLGKKKIAVLWRKDDWGLSAKDQYEDELKNLGGEIVLSEGISDGTQDFKSVLTKIKGLNPDAIYAALFYQDAAVMTQQAKQLGVTTPIIGAGSLYNVQLLNLAQGAADGMYLPTTYFPGNPDPKAVDFITRYKEKFGVEPDNFAAHAYDAAMLLFDSMKKSDLTRTSIRDALLETSKGYKGLTGDLTFDANRRVHKDFTWLLVENNEFTLYKK